MHIDNRIAGPSDPGPGSSDAPSRTCTPPISDSFCDRLYADTEIKALVRQLPAVTTCSAYVEPPEGPAVVARDRLPAWLEVYAASRWFGVPLWWLFGLVADGIVEAIQCEGRALVSVGTVSRFLAEASDAC